MASDPTAVDTATLIASATADLALINQKLWDAAETLRETKAVLAELARRHQQEDKAQ